MAGTLLPWGMGMCAAYCAAAAFLAEPSFPRKLAFAATGAICVVMLAPVSGYGPGRDLLLRACICLLWLPAVEAAALRVKEGGTTSSFLPRCCAVLTACAALAWLLPMQYNRITMNDRFSQNGIYSPVLKQFILWESTPGSQSFSQEDGEKLGWKTARHLAPLFFHSDMHKWGEFPLVIEGRTLSYDEAALAARSISLRPRLWNSPPIPLHALLESSPEGANLDLPPDVFRIRSSSLEFIQCADGKIDTEKSSLYTNALTASGARFPLTAASVNATVRKPFDMGALLADSQGQIFRLQTVNGKPVSLNTGLSVPGRLRALMVNEHAARDFYGMAVTDSEIYLIMHDNTLLKLPLNDFNANTDAVVAQFDPLHIVLSLQKLPPAEKQPLKLLAADRQGNVRHAFTASLPGNIVERRRMVEDGSSFLFPFSLRQFEPAYKDAGLSVHAGSPLGRHLGFAFLGGCVWALLLFLARRKKARPISVEYAFVFVSGLPGLLALLAFGPLKEHSAKDAPC